MQVICKSCGAKLNAKPEWAGKKAKCNKCGERIIIPYPPTENLEPAPTQKKPVPPATEKQKQYATALGIDYPDEINIRDISALIDAAQDAECGRIDTAYEKRDEQWEKVRKAVIEEIEDSDCLLSNATAEQMIESLRERDIAAVLITLPADAVVYADDTNEDIAETLAGVTVQTHFSEDMQPADMWRLVEVLYLNQKID